MAFLFANRPFQQQLSEDRLWQQQLSDPLLLSSIPQISLSDQHPFTAGMESFEPDFGSRMRTKERLEKIPESVKRGMEAETERKRPDPLAPISAFKMAQTENSRLPDYSHRLLEPAPVYQAFTDRDFQASLDVESLLNSQSESEDRRVIPILTGLEESTATTREPRSKSAGPLNLLDTNEDFLHWERPPDMGILRKINVK